MKPLFLCCFCFTLFLSTASLAQLKIIEVDSVRKVPSEALPFDQEFWLKIPITTSSAGGVEIIKHKGRRSWGESIGRMSQLHTFWSKLHLTRSKFTIPLIAKEDLDIQKNALIIRVRDRNLLKSGRNYTFLILNKVTPEVKKLFRHYHDYVSGNPLALGNAQLVYTALQKREQELLKAPNVYYTFLGTTVDPLLSIGIQPKYNDYQLGPRFRDFDMKVADLASHTGRLSSGLLLNHPGDYEKLLNLIAKPSTALLDDKFKQKYLIDSSRLKERLFLLSKADLTLYTNLTGGLISINCQNCKPVKPDEYAAQEKNILATLTAISEIEMLANVVSNIGAVGFSVGFLPNLTSFKQELLKSQQVRQEILKADQEIEKAILDSKMVEITPMGGNTLTYNFETRTKFSIAPDFGIITTRIGNDGLNPYPFLPYLGFHVNFNPINRDVPFTSYRKSLLQRVSFTTGWSLVNVGDGPVQRGDPDADSVRGFFDKSALITGLGFRIGNAARLTTGWAWHFKYERNDATQPKVYTDRKFGGWFFVGLAIDLSPKTIIEGIDEVFKGSPRSFKRLPTTAE